METQETQIKKEVVEKPQKAKKEFFAKSREKKKTDDMITPDRQKNYESILNDISGSLKAVLFDGSGNELKKIPVRELTDEKQLAYNHNPKFDPDENAFIIGTCMHINIVKEFLK